MAREMGARIGIYEVAGKLGVGRMGKAYRAHHTTLGRGVVRKVRLNPSRPIQTAFPGFNGNSRSSGRCITGMALIDARKPSR